MNSSPARASAFLLSDVFCVLGAILCSMAGFSHITKYFHGTQLILFAAGIAIVVTVAMLWLRWMHLKPRKPLTVQWLALPWALFALLFVLLFPLAHQHTLGGGSDRDDALRVSASALVHWHYLYSAKTFLGNQVTPLPGAILMATPFYLLGNVSLQNIFWLALFSGFASWFFRGSSTAMIYLLVLLGTSAANLDDFVVGGDYLVNAMYVCIAVALVIAAHKENVALWPQVASEVFLGLAVDSRPIYIVVFPVLLAYLCQRQRRSAAVRALLVAGSVAALLSVPFYLYDPAHFGPLHIRHKLDFIPAQYHAALVLPALGLLACGAGFLIRLSRQGVYLLIGVSLFCVLALPGLLAWFFHPFTLLALYQMSLVASPALFFSLWIFSKYEDTGYALRLRRERSTLSIGALS